MNAWLGLKRPLFLAFFLGCTVSFLTSGTLTLRLIGPVMIYWSVHPIGLRNEAFAAQLRQFFGRTRLTAIGDSDYHIGPMSPQLGEMGLCRTYVFVRERTEKDLLDALREGRTVVYDRDHVYGDPAMIRLAAEDGQLPKLALTGREPNFAGLFSGTVGLLGLLAWILTCGGVWRRLD